MDDLSSMFHLDRFRQGLDRVAKVIEAVSDYDRILGPRRLDRPHYSAAVAAHAAGNKTAAAAVVVAAIGKARVTVYRIPSDASTLSFANTHNNKVELAFLAQKCARIAPLETCELTECEKLGGPALSELNYFSSLAAAVEQFLGARESITRSLFHQLINYAAAYCSFLHSLTAAGVCPRGLVLANDHSPLQVALSMVAAQFGMRRVYLQHAEVTEAFPALDFEYAILRNRKSAGVYAAIGNITGEVLVLSRRPHAPSAESILQRVAGLTEAERVEVGLYPSSAFNETQLREAVRVVLANPGICRVFIKPHPSKDVSGLAAELGVECLSSTPLEPHVAIVGNSSVALELALGGHLVCQLYALDSVGRDYYGFCTEGLTREIKHSALDKPFWRSVKLVKRFRDAVARRCAEESSGLEGAQEQRFLRRLMIDLGCAFRPGLASAERLARYLAFFPSSALAMLRRQGTELFDGLELMKLLDQLFHERRIDLPACYPFVDFAGCSSLVDFWFIAKRVEWNGSSLTAESGRSLLDFTRHLAHDAKLQGWLESKLFDLYLRAELDHLLVDLLRDARQFSVTGASINRKIAFVRKLGSGTAVPALATFYDHAQDTLVGLDRLKMAVQCHLRDAKGPLYADYRQVEEEFLLQANPALAQEYRQLVMAPYAVLAQRCHYIDVRRKPDQVERLLARVATCLRERRPFAAIRLSDGEGYLFRERHPYFTEEDARNRERHWWGEELDSGTRARVTAAGLLAVKEADVVGIPSIYRFLRDHSARSTTLLGGLQGRGLVSVLQGVGEVAREDAEFGDDKLNLAAFNQIKHLQRLARVGNKVIVVNGAREEVLVEAFAALGRVEVISIPTHHKTVGNQKFISATRPLPYVFESIAAQIQRMTEPGTLVLVGGGIAGKSFIGAARRAGGVGLDLGSALDELVGAGIHSLH